VVHFEYAQAAPGSALVSPIVTDFTRREQGLIRYRMNDLFDLDPRPCPCGSAFQAVRRIEGRSDDAFLLADKAGVGQLVTPDILRNAVVDADPRINDFRIVQTGPASIAVHLPEGLDADLDARVSAGLETALARRGLAAAVTVQRGIALDFTRKLRRVSRDWRDPAQP
jgi:phenylacetate-coenzyme A ligase PaaK-like adenylate-forming protein